METKAPHSLNTVGMDIDPSARRSVGSDPSARRSVSSGLEALDDVLGSVGLDALDVGGLDPLPALPATWRVRSRTSLASVEVVRRRAAATKYFIIFVCWFASDGNGCVCLLIDPSCNTDNNNVKLISRCTMQNKNETKNT